ncbi:MAG: hypothetical protein E7L01_28995 [Paenibacillus macerans]|uniref:PrpF family protein n=1 Tax=Paenibacillus macerans TaxID=44252 RepID=A0A090Y531_PAEMA|nr:hypothetical protein [Paenibacillus macerans]KFM93544.1 prpF family protein [Paenibacillus macerans]MBS5914858.1 hypothetical protein [Paenibacillus macerans]MCY7562609.1 hypothetical protein [Paenibacillus macerans]MDU5947469.1 hypothetical protein [Paenibacillus macerans]MDU7477340.1 hypothetical protein [Paenibacillus macerans]
MNVQVALLRSGKSNIAVIDQDLPRDSGKVTELLQNIYLITLKLGFPTTKVVTIGSLFRNRQSLQFYQYIPGSGTFDAGGNCGNALMAAYVYLYQLHPDNTVSEMRSSHSDFAIRIKELQARTKREYSLWAELYACGPKPRQVLPLGEARCLVSSESHAIEASIVDAGNPYIWVKAESISPKALKEWDEVELLSLARLRASIQPRLGIAKGSVFPKIAAFARLSDESAALRMISVDDWHPSFALTGLLNFAAALFTPDTLIRLAFPDTRRLALYLPDGILVPEFGETAVVMEQNVEYIGGITVELDKKVVV